MTSGAELKPRVLVVCDYYLPGYKSGGGMRTVANTVSRMSDEFDFLVITRDHDGKGDKSPYPEIAYDTWNDVSGAKVFYLKPEQVHARTIRRLIDDTRPSLVYLNSFFSPLTFLTLRIRKASRQRFPNLLVAPCGELSPGAMRSKILRKRVYILITRILGLFKHAEFKASCADEVNEIHSVVGDEGAITVAPDIAADTRSVAVAPKPAKTAGRAKFVFLSRISPKKNLDFLIEALRDFPESATLDIFGDADDGAYLDKCLAAAAGADNIRFHGPLDNLLVPEMLSQFDFFALPTLGENFGHVILEALASGCPPVIADTTPWNHLDADGAGKVIPLERARWVDALRECIEMTDEEYRAFAMKARDSAARHLEDSSIEDMTRNLLRKCSVRSE